MKCLQLQLSGYRAVNQSELSQMPVIGQLTGE